MILLFSVLPAAGQAIAAGAPETAFACSFGARQVEVVREGSRLTYRFGRPGRPELALTGDAASGTLSTTALSMRAARTRPCASKTATIPT